MTDISNQNGQAQEDLPDVSGWQSGVPQKETAGTANARSITNYDPTTTTPEDYANVSGARVAANAASTLAPSLVRSVLSIPQTVQGIWDDPSGSVSGIRNISLGLAAKGNKALGIPHGGQFMGMDNPDLSQYEKYADPITQPFSSWGGFAKTMSENPADLLTLAAPGLGEEKLLSKGLELGADASNASKALRVAKQAKRVLTNPAAAALDVSGYGLGKIGDGLNWVGSKGSGVSQTSLDAIREAAMSEADGSPYSMAVKKAQTQGVRSPLSYDQEVNGTLSGKVSEVDLANRIKDAAKAASKERSDAFLSDRKNATAVSSKIDYAPVWDSVYKKETELGINGGAGSILFPDAQKAMEEARVRVGSSELDASGKTDLEKFDALKRSLYDLSDSQTSQEAKSAVKSVWDSAHSQLFNASPEYASAMSDYQDALQGKVDFNKGLSLGKNTASGTTINKVIKTKDNPFQTGILDSIYAKDPGLKYAIAGAEARRAIQASPSLGRHLLSVMAAAPGVYHALVNGDQVAGGLISVGGVLGTEAATSPRAVVGANRMVGNAMSGPDAAIARVAQKAVGPINAATTNYQDSQGGLPDVSDFTSGLPQAQSTGGRITRKSGGRTSNSIGAEVNRVRILLRNKTQHMLSVPDDAIATALHMAKNG